MPIWWLLAAAYTVLYHIYGIIRLPSSINSPGPTGAGTQPQARWTVEETSRDIALVCVFLISLAVLVYYSGWWTLVLVLFTGFWLLRGIATIAVNVRLTHTRKAARTASDALNSLAFNLITLGFDLLLIFTHR